ncbi:MAG: stage V sporulation protein AC [Clostridia bacterium]
MKMTKKEYGKYVSGVTPKSPIALNMLKAFVIGGLICVVGQALINMYKYLNMTIDDAAAATSITLIAISALLTGVGIYDKIAKHAGAGTLVPITGFANAIVSSALEFKSEGYIIGMCGKMFALAGPVLVMGTSASVLYGLILLFFI